MAGPVHIVLRVVRAPEASGLAMGATFPVPAPYAVVGRAPDADVVLNDPTVSRRHLAIHAGPPVHVESLTTSNGTFVDRQPLEPGTRVALEKPDLRLQLGGVVLAVGWLAETTPVVVPITSVAKEGAAEGAVLQVRWDAGQCSIRCGGKQLGLTGAAARMLGLLAEQPGEVVHHWDLQQELDTPHLAPLATAIRQALASAVHEGILPTALLQSRVQAAMVTPETAPANVTQLMRQVLQSRRGHGYVLHLTPSDVAISRV